MVKRYWAILIVGLIIIQAFHTTLCAGQARPESTTNLIAEVRQRIETDRLEVRVYQGKKLVQLARYTELYVVMPLPGPPKTIENLAKRSVAIFRSEKNPDRWEVYQDVWAGAGDELMTLADNVFKVKQVFISSQRSPIELRLDGQIMRLKAGDALLVL
jgi:hypothetical protein